ncbi:MAG: hypothetical protein ABI743_10445 [bacterium]
MSDASNLCPACRNALSVGAKVCDKCGLALDTKSFDLIIEMMEEDGAIWLGTAPDRMAAEIVRGRLIGEGIPAELMPLPDVQIASQFVGGTTPWRVMVPANDARRALEVVSVDLNWEDGELERYLSMLEEAPAES